MIGHCIFTSRGSELSFTNLSYRRVQTAWQKKSHLRFSNLVSKIFKKKYNKPNFLSTNIILTEPGLWKPPYWRQLIILSSISFHFLSKWSHKYWLVWGSDDTGDFYSAVLMGLGGSWIFNSGNSKSGFVCLSFSSADPESRKRFSSRMEDDWKLANRLASRLAYWKGLLDQNHVTGMCAIFDLLPNKKRIWHG